ncbi:MAG: CBS domain-containing protein [Myxococcales bacterium]|nr:CBS domain-containing protein [Myxococcales bacterium]
MMDPMRMSLKRVMTPFPHAVDTNASVTEAIDLMEEHGIHHLPVTDSGRLHGIVSDADLRVARAVGGGTRLDPSMPVGLICTMNPYVAPLDTPLAEVATTMASRRLGSALVTRNGKLVGILTTTDVCRALAELLGSVPPEDPAKRLEARSANKAQ